MKASLKKKISLGATVMAILGNSIVGNSTTVNLQNTNNTAANNGIEKMMQNQGNTENKKAVIKTLSNIDFDNSEYIQNKAEKEKDIDIDMDSYVSDLLTCIAFALKNKDAEETKEDIEEVVNFVTTETMEISGGGSDPQIEHIIGNVNTYEKDKILADERTQALKDLCMIRMDNNGKICDVYGNRIENTAEIDRFYTLESITNFKEFLGNTLEDISKTQSHFYKLRQSMAQSGIVSSMNDEIDTNTIKVHGNLYCDYEIGKIDNSVLSDEEKDKEKQIIESTKRTINSYVEDNPGKKVEVGEFTEELYEHHLDNNFLYRGIKPLYNMITVAEEILKDDKSITSDLTERMQKDLMDNNFDLTKFDENYVIQAKKAIQQERKEREIQEEIANKRENKHQELLDELRQTLTSPIDNDINQEDMKKLDQIVDTFYVNNVALEKEMNETEVWKDIGFVVPSENKTSTHFVGVDETTVPDEVIAKLANGNLYIIEELKAKLDEAETFEDILETLTDYNYNLDDFENDFKINNTEEFTLDNIDDDYMF